MAIDAGTASAAGGAATDLFAGFAATTKANLTAKGQHITASGTRITEQGTRISAEGTDLSADSLRLKAGGDIAEAENYDLAAALARQNETYTEASTRIQQSQLDRQLTQTIGGQRAAVAGAGFSSSGSALDIMRDSASQGSLARSVLGAQGQITEAGFEEQAKSYETMSAAGRATAAGEFGIADKTNVIAGQQRGIADQQDVIATQQDQLASDTEAAGKQEQKADFTSAAIKGAIAVASIGLAPFTGGASLVLGGLAGSMMGGGTPTGILGQG